MDEASTSREGEPQPSDLAADGSLSPSPSSSSQSVPWRPNELIFCPYSSILDSDARPRTLHDVVRRPRIDNLFLQSSPMSSFHWNSTLSSK
ncbi:unnamed protein product, partial [Ilex paraguariensis]